ncbi:MAG: hypothetical protein ABSA13_17315, partial [Beijerinckiaceae bacterium]
LEHRHQGNDKDFQTAKISKSWMEQRISTQAHPSNLICDCPDVNGQIVMLLSVLNGFYVPWSKRGRVNVRLA